LSGAGLKGITSFGSYAPFSWPSARGRPNSCCVPQKNYAFDLEDDPARRHAENRSDLHCQSQQSDGNSVRHVGAGEFCCARARRRAGWCWMRRTCTTRRAWTGESPRRFTATQECADSSDVFEVYGLAGLRIGFRLGGRSCAAAMKKRRTPFNTSGVAQAAALQR